MHIYKWVLYLNTLGNTLISLRRFEDAIMMFNKVIQIDQKNSDAFYRKGK